jgi:required for meiotic nuclear division protein 1
MRRHQVMERCRAKLHPVETTLSVEAYAIAGTVLPRDVAALFEEGAERVKISKTTVVVRYDATSWAVAHDFGVLVFISVPPAEQQRVVQQLATNAGEQQATVVESFLVELRPDSKPSALFDRVVLPELDARNVELVSMAIGQSVGMEYYEESIDQLLKRLEGTSRQLAETGGFRGRSRELLSLIGQGMTTRSQVVSTLALLDAPALAWDNEALDRLFRDLRLSFAIEDRYRTLDQKLRMIQDQLELLVDLSQHRRSNLLEIAVIALIALEIVLAFVRH